VFFKKILYITSNRSDYAKVKKLLKDINEDSDFELYVVATSAQIKGRFGSGVKELEDDGLNIYKKIDCMIEGDSRLSMLKSSALEMYELTNIIENLKPDIGIIVGDRYDILTSVYVLSLMNIPIAHIQGGEITGTIDDVIRDVITKFSHIHFVSNEDAKDRVVSLCEDEKNVYNVGCPSFDYIKNLDIPDYVDYNLLLPFCKDVIDLKNSDDYFIVMVHPNVAIEEDVDMKVITEALDAFDNKKIVFYPNTDPFHQNIVNVINRRKDYIKFKHVSMECFMMLLKNCKMMIGNSSSGIRETCFFGVPTINIGKRQEGRLNGENVTHVPCEKDAIINAIKCSYDKKFSPEYIYGDGNASEKIIEILKSYEGLKYKNIFKEK
jgi:UDP-hydrolysing UDP-N-acetyl-D-glucosamine 2-epimerase